ncbi:MAG: GyrI-like domain-containing protein [Oscillospiraceae bacterium]|nr:GyrI-like domain-containing protein [Oscillospiraceae bacterium]
MEYKIVEKPQFTLMGISRKFQMETSYQQIPEFWTEMMAKPDFPLMGMYGVCVDGEDTGKEFDYWIADDYTPCREIPAPCHSLVMPAGTWAVFPCKLKTLQDINTKVWQEWLPNCREYKLSGNYNIEMYGPMYGDEPGESYVELWLPVEKV